MLPYWLLFLFWASGALQYQRQPSRTGGSAGFWLAIFGTALFVGLRWHVGGDWGNYQRQFDQMSNLSVGQALQYTDPAYGLLNWVVARLGFGVVYVNLVCALIFMGGVGTFAVRQANPWLAVTIGVPYFIIVVGMGYTRQATAIGLVLIGLAISDRRSLLNVILFVTAGALFHKSAALAMPLIASSLMRRNFLLLIVGLVGSAAIYAWVLRGAADTLVGNYVNSTYQSSGAAIRIAMNAAAGIIFFIQRRKLQFSASEDFYWFISSVLSFVCIVGLAGFSSSVGVDRLALFLIPLQLAVYSQLPYSLSGGRSANSWITLSVILYSSAVLFVFFNFGQNSYGWIPYNWILFAESAR